MRKDLYEYSEFPRLRFEPAEMSEQQLPDYPQLLFALLVMLSSFQEVWLYMWSLQNKPR